MIRMMDGVPYRETSVAEALTDHRQSPGYTSAVVRDAYTPGSMHAIRGRYTIGTMDAPGLAPTEDARRVAMDPIGALRYR